MPGVSLPSLNNHSVRETTFRERSRMKQVIIFASSLQSDEIIDKIRQLYIKFSSCVKTDLLRLLLRKGLQFETV